LSYPSDHLPPSSAPLDYVPGRTPPPAQRPAAIAPLQARFSRRLTLLPLVMVMFFSVSGGAYGLEDAIGDSGGLGLVLLVVVPLIWTLPVALMVAELSAAMPVEGGYYAWVKKGLGSFWGFQEGWWSWVNSFVDMAIYPVLFASYLSTLLKREFDTTFIADHRIVHWAITLALIWTFTLLNIRGVRLVGRTLVLFGVLVLAPFAVLSIMGISDLVHEPRAIWRPFIPEDSSLLSAFGLGLFVVLWNYLGWDGPSTVAGEVQRPARTYNRAMVIAIPLVIIAYVLPVGAGLTAVPASQGPPDTPAVTASATPDAATNTPPTAADGPAAGPVWTEGEFPTIAEAVGGHWLGTWIALGALVSASGLFSALLLSNSRLPFVLAEDGYLPDRLRALHQRFETPWISLIVCSMIYSFFALGDFKDLVELDVIIYAASLFLEFAALIALRRSLPRMARPFRVPGGATGLALIAIAPVGVIVLALAGTIHESGVRSLLPAVVILASGPILYPVCRLVFKRGRPDVDVPVALEPSSP
jgi:amino acid transporter